MTIIKTYYCDALTRREHHAEYILQLFYYVLLNNKGPCYKTFFELNSAEHEILNARKSKNIKQSGMLFFLLIRVEMPTTVGISTFMSRKNSCSAELSVKKVL